MKKPFAFSTGLATQTSPELIFHIINMSQDSSVYWSAHEMSLQLRFFFRAICYYEKKGENYELLSVYFHSWLSLIFVQNIVNPVSHRANACINPRRIGSIAYPVETLQADQNGISIFFAAYRTSGVTRTHSCGSVFISGTKTRCWNLTLIKN